MRILLGTDGSPSAGVAVDLVAAIDWPPGTAIRAVEAIETGAALFGGPWPAIDVPDVATLEAEVRAAARATVEEARARLRRPGVEVAAAVLTGRPATAIVEAARTMDADLVVVGSRGRGTIESMLLGSVSSEVVGSWARPGPDRPAPDARTCGARVGRLRLFPRRRGHRAHLAHLPQRRDSGRERRGRRGPVVDGLSGRRVARACRCTSRQPMCRAACTQTSPGT